LELSWLTPIKDRSMVLVGSKKSLFVNLTAQKIQVYEDNQMKDLNIVQNNTISDELANFLECMKDRKISINDGLSGLYTIKMIEITRQSLFEKKTLQFDFNSN
jgi:hypothetical protein